MFCNRHALSVFLGMFLGSWGKTAISCGQDAATAQTYQDAITLFDQGAYAEALPLFESVYTKEPYCIGAKLDIAVTYFRLEQYTSARHLLQEILATDGIDEGIRQQCDGFLLIIDEKTSTPAVSNVGTLPRLQVSAGLGVSDNVNNGLSFDRLTIGSEDEPLTLLLGDKSKAQSGSWNDVEVALNKTLPVVGAVETQAQLTATWRDSHQNDSLDLAVVRGMVEMKPGDWMNDVELRFVASGGVVRLDDESYRQDSALAAQIQMPNPLLDKKIALSYQLTDSHYTTPKVVDNNSVSQRVGVGIPLPSPAKPLRLNLDISHQRPVSAERLADYTETSVRFRADYRPPERKYGLSASYRVSQQHDEAVYNEVAFPEKRRDPTQQILNVGWSWQVRPDLTWETRIQAREQNSDIPLFENQAVDLTTGIRWQLD